MKFKQAQDATLWNSLHFVVVLSSTHVVFVNSKEVELQWDIILRLSIK